MTSDRPDALFEVPVGAGGEPFEESDLRRRTDFQSRAPRSGADFKAMAIKRLQEAGGTIERLDFEVNGFPVDAQVRGQNGRRFLVLARGTPDEHRLSGVRKTDTLEKAGFRAIQLARCQDLAILLVTSDLPGRSTKAGRYLAALAEDVWDVVAYRGDFPGFRRLRSAFQGPTQAEPPLAPWRAPLQGMEPTLFDQTADQDAEPERFHFASNEGEE